MHHRAYILGVTATLALSACGGGGSSGGLPAVGSGSIPSAPNPSGGTQAAAVSFGAVSTKPFATGEKRLLAPREANYGGTFTVTSSNPAVLSAAPRSGAGPFTLTGIAPGTAVITASDTNGRSGTLTFTVSATMAVPGASEAPISTGPPGASPVPEPTPTAIALPIPVPPAPGQPTPAPGQPSATPIAVTVPVGGLDVLSGVGTNVTATVGNPALATAVSLGNGMLALVGTAPGVTQLDVTSSAGTTVAAVTVPATLPLINVPSDSLSLSLLKTLGANVSVVSAGEAGYTGGFTASAQNSAVAVVAPIPLANNQFLVTSVGPGATFLTLQDALGHTRYIAVDVP